MHAMRTIGGPGRKVLSLSLSLALAAALCPPAAYGQEDGAPSRGMQKAYTASAASTSADAATPPASGSPTPQQGAALASPSPEPAVGTGSAAAPSDAGIPGSVATGSAPASDAGGSVSVAAEPALSPASYAAVGTVFTGTVSVGGGQVPCTYEVTGAGTVQIGDGNVCAISTSLAGALVIPESVPYGGESYAVTSLGDYAFCACTSLTSTGLATNSTVTSLGGSAFRGCTSLSGDLVLGLRVSSVGSCAFFDTGYTAVYLLAPGPSSISVGDGAFVFSGGAPALNAPASWYRVAVFTAGTKTYRTSDGSLVIGNPPSLSDVSVSRSSARSASVSLTSSVFGIASVVDASGHALWSALASPGTSLTAVFSGVVPDSAALDVRIQSGSISLICPMSLPVFSYSVSFDGNGASAGSMGPQAMSWGSSAALAASAYSRDGWSFTGWNTAPDGSGTAYADGQSVSDLAESDTVLYAQWAPAPGTVFTGTVSAGGGQVPCTYKVTGAGIVQIGDGEQAAIPASSAGDLAIPASIVCGGRPYAVKAIGANAFYNCAALASTGLESNSTVTSIGDDAFDSCTSLVSTGLESNSAVESIEAVAFANCTSLTSTGLESNSSVASLGTLAFGGCTSLESTGLATNSSVASLGERAFSGCTSLAFTGLASNSTVTSIGDYAFLGCSKLASTGLATNSTVTSIGSGAFNNCPSLADTGLASNSTVASLGEAVFAGDVSLASTGLESNSTVTTLGPWAFFHCTSLTSTGLESNSSVASIGESAFGECPSLTGDLVLGPNVSSVGKSAFKGAGCTAVYLLAPGPSSVSVGSGAFVFSGGTPPLHVPASWAGTASFSTGTETYSVADESLVIMPVPADPVHPANPADSAAQGSSPASAVQASGAAGLPPSGDLVPLPALILLLALAALASLAASAVLLFARRGRIRVPETCRDGEPPVAAGDRRW